MQQTGWSDTVLNLLVSSASDRRTSAENHKPIIETANGVKTWKAEG